MNNNQKINNRRIQRKFTRGDNVIADGKEGVIMSSFTHGDTIGYYVNIPNQPLKEYVQSQLTSKPSLDTHKYGSKQSGYTGGNNY